MSTVQLDLFDLLDPGTPETPPPRLSGPGHCPDCGEAIADVAAYDTAGHSINHWGHPDPRGECTPMYLTRNHVLAALDALACLHQNGLSCPNKPGYLCLAHGVGGGKPLTKKAAAHNHAHWTTELHRSWARATDVWRNHLDRLHAQIAPHLEAAGLTPTDLKETP